MTALIKKDLFLECEQPWEKDKLDRKEVAQYLTPIIGSIRQPFVISLNSPYGMGKTFFIKNWQKELIDKGYKAVYFNAWKTDYAEDALIAFISSIRDQLDEISSDKNEETRKKLSDAVKKAQPYLNKNILPSVMRILTRIAVGSQVANDIENELSELAGDLASQSLSKHEEIKRSIEEFKSSLKSAVTELTEDADDEDKKKLIIFVDELDRCRPNYAIEVLECIKHLFDVEGLVFILAIDEEQVRDSVASVYGVRQDGEGYLNKFIDWQLKLPEPSRHEYTKFLFEEFDLGEIKRFGCKPNIYKDYGIDKSGLFENNQNIFSGRDAFIAAFSVFSEFYKLTPRQQAKCFTDINLVVRSLGNGQLPLSQMLAIITVLKTHYGEEIRDYCLGKKPVEELMDKIKPISETEGFKRIFRSWDVFKPFFHVWFLDDNRLDALNARAERISSQYNKIKDNSDEKRLERKEMEKEMEYLDEVKRNYRNYQTQIGMGIGTIAETVYMRLEKASYLNVRGI